MKHLWRSFVKDYFTFSKRERVGIIVLIISGCFFYFLPDILVTKKEPPDFKAFEKDIASLKIYRDSSRAYRSERSDDEISYYYQPRKYAFDNNQEGELFYFDPNTLNQDDWKKLGIRDRTIQTIQKLIAKGFRFRKPDDIKKIYGLKADQAERLLPFVKIENITASSNFIKQHTPVNTFYSSQAAIKEIDINTADTAAFISLPGIGNKLASRIINFRDKLGGFANVNQVGETYGLPDSIFQKVKGKLHCNANSVKKLNINTADVNLLRTHPYIKWNIANTIVNYRQQHGNFKSLEDLKNIDIIDNNVYNKIAPYLTN